MVDFEIDIDHCLVTLRNGGLILYPTDTIWGIGCDATNEEAVRKIYALKKRPDEKAMIVLVAEESDVIRHVAAADLALFDYLGTVAKPTTVIYNGAIGLAENLIGRDGSIAIRICKDPFCRQLLKRFRKPIVSTSANISGEPVAAIFSDISPEIISGVDYVVKYRQEDDTIHAPSSIVRVDASGNILIIRA